jgi:Mg2+ and Co2+ transporter CorA
MLTVDVRRGDRTEHHTDLNSIQEILSDPKSLFWIDITDPTDAEWQELADKFHFTRWQSRTPRSGTSAPK